MQVSRFFYFLVSVLVVTKYDDEYKRNGVCTIFMACEPLAGKDLVKITEKKTKRDWPYFLAEIADHYSDAEKNTLVMENLKLILQVHHTKHFSLQKRNSFGIVMVIG